MGVPRLIDGRTSPLPTFHFHIVDGGADRDLDGTELPDIKAAKREALRCVSFLMCDAAMVTNPTDEWHVEVADSAGLVLFRVDAAVVDAA